MDVGGRAHADTAPHGWERWFLADLNCLRHPVQLLCLPHAGGSASSYRDWMAGLTSDVDVLPVQLPGRENRMREPCAASMHELVGGLVSAVRLAGFRRIALFGHSLGAVVALKACEALERAGMGVGHLFVSGHPGPARIPVRNTLRMAEADDELLLLAMDGLDNALTGRLADAELQAMILPVVRSDLRMLAGCPLGSERIETPVTVIGGASDPLLADQDLASWAALTSGGCDVHWLKGDHFYLAADPAALTRIVRERLTPAPPLGGARPARCGGRGS